MQKIDIDIYRQINNDVYKEQGDIWWQPNTVLHILKTSVNPWRVGYAANVLKRLKVDPKGKAALEVGCGGGILTEEIARMGFETTGIDPAAESITTASNHAKARVA
ncbi:methyltransferase domain-containing protein [Chitinophaga sedimenti]|uniref:methyltransferase domain-containing protein n=1 Tax=Chitinophaga sedimenti TaxID=2033606 RepID=UPI00249F664C|nr:methyltransferase domain-containing protein [Chitinophaga sedimenti]